MAPITQSTLYEQSLHSSALELKYERSSHLVDLIAKDEDVRRLRFNVHVLQDDNDELRELLQQEEDRSDAFERLVNDNLARAETAEEQIRALEDELRFKDVDLQRFEAESRALKEVEKDASVALTEKLALTRELSVLKPELEHLKVQAVSTEALVKEKLELQRQITNVQCELENAKRDTKRALAKRRNTGVEIAQEEQVEDLKKQLKKAERARQRAEEAADAASGSQDVDDVRKQLAKEKRARQKAEEELEVLRDATQIEDVRKDLLKEKKASSKLQEELELARTELETARKSVLRAEKRADGKSSADEQAEELREELSKANKERVKAEKLAQNVAEEFDARKAVLDDKLIQFRTKLRTTKDKLKETEAELAALKESATAAPAVAKKTAAATLAKPAPSKNPKKRVAAQMDPDTTTLGTPGDGPAAKRGRKQALGVGDKSTFSVTPFLNKTMSVVPEDSDAEGEKLGKDTVREDDQASPVATKQKKQPLNQKSASEANKQTKPRQRKQQKPPVLEIVTEENEDVHSQGQENASKASEGTTMKVKTKTDDGPDPVQAGTKKQKPKLRKSLADFATFNQEPEPEKRQKKRKLGGLGKTLFDEEEEQTAPSRAMPGGKALLLGSKGLGGFGKKSGAGGLGSSILGGRSFIGNSKLMSAIDGSGFMFSPLKRSRKNLDDTLRG